MPFLEAKGITKTFGSTTALDDVQLLVEAGEVHALVGENGSGKSTMMKILAGVIQPNSGSITLDGKPYKPRSPLEARIAGISMIHQELSICGDLSVAENILLGMEDTSVGVINRSLARQKAREALTQLGQGDLDPETPAKNLPLATRQLIEIGRSIAIGSRVVILDEPTSSLTEKDVENLFRVVNSLRASGKAIIYISHFLDELHAISDRMTILRDGKFIKTVLEKDTTDADIVHAMVGREIEDLYPRSQRPLGDPIIEVQHVTGLSKPTDANLTLRRGEVLGIAGLNGSGRTELLRAVFGLDSVRSGTVKVGTYQGAASPAIRWKQGVGMLSENRKEEGLFLNLSIAENTIMASMDKPFVNPHKQSREAGKWVEKLRVKCQGPDQIIGHLSGGNQQKVALARMLHKDVDVLLLDEPTRGIDVGSKQEIYALIDDLALKGRAVIMVSSYLPELLGTCDRIAVMNRGVLSEPVSVQNATQESLMQLAIS